MILRVWRLRAGVAGVWLLAVAHMGAQTSVRTQAALEKALRGTRAEAVVLDWNTGAEIASVWAGLGGGPRTTPGSVVKPLLLEYALEHGVVRPATTVYCRRSLHVAGRNLACTHPATQPVFDAESALAESCNTWFAEMAHRMTGVQLDEALRAAHLQHEPMQAADADARVLAVLGLVGVVVMPGELARSYRDLLLHIRLDGVVARGLRESVEYGMANPARVPGVVLLGKTGTASAPGQAWTHGWFAGALPGKLVVVIYVPHGDGGTAASLAAAFVREVGR